MGVGWGLLRSSAKPTRTAPPQLQHTLEWIREKARGRSQPFTRHSTVPLCAPSPRAEARSSSKLRRSPWGQCLQEQRSSTCSTHGCMTRPEASPRHASGVSGALASHYTVSVVAVPLYSQWQYLCHCEYSGAGTALPRSTCATSDLSPRSPAQGPLRAPSSPGGARSPRPLRRRSCGRPGCRGRCRAAAP